MRFCVPALVCLAFACKTVTPPPTPGKAGWAPGHSVSISGPESSEPGTNAAVLLATLTADLRAAGFRFFTGSGAEFVVSLHQLTVASLTADLMRGGEQVASFTLESSEPCYNSWGFGAEEQNMKCWGAVLAERVARLELPPAAVSAEPAIPTAAPGRTLSGKLAVLELRNFTKDLTHENAQYFTDVVRSAALKAQPQLQVMTRENLLVLLQASGKDLANCEGECEVDTGRRIGADEIVSGEIQKLGTLYKLSLRLHDTREGRLLASTQASGRTAEELDAAVQKAAADLLH